MSFQFDLDDALKNSVVCQKRTGKYKQFTLVQGSRIVKGPYTEDRLSRLMARSVQLKKWKVPLIVHPNSEVLTSAVGPFVTYPNLAEGYPVESDPHTESFSSYSYRVLRRSGLIKLGDALKEKTTQGEIPWILEQMEDMLMALITIYLLDVGDTGLYNMLVDIPKRRIYLIDYDEVRGVDRINGETELFYFSRPPAKKIVDLWLPVARRVYSKVIQRLRLITEPEYAGAITEIMTKLSGWVSSSDGESSDKPGPHLIVIPQPEQPGNMGKMKFGGMFGGTLTYSGYPLDVIKSAVQKYIRRGQVEKAVISAVEMYRLVEVGGRAVQTNLFNRLAIIAGEDIGPANLPLVLAVLTTLDQDKRDIVEMIAMVHLLAGSEKTRIGSHLWRTYAVPEGVALARTKGVTVDTALSESDLGYLSDITSGKRKSPVAWKPSDPLEIQPYAEIFAKRLSEKDPNAVTWAAFFLEASKDKKVAPRGRRTKPIVILWEILEPLLGGPKEGHDLLRKFSMDLTEYRPFLMTAIAYVLFEPSRERHSLAEEIARIQETAAIWRASPALPQIRSGDYELTIDDFVIDKHTAAGSRQGKSRKEFVEEGALVVPNSSIYDLPVYAEIYRSS